MTPPTMKQWRQLVLAGMLAWLLLFLALLSHFLDPRAMVPRSRATSSLTHPETRRLASIQGSQREIRASPPETSLSFSSSPPQVNQDPSWGDQTQGGPTRHSREETQEGDPRVDPQALAVWSNFRDGVDGGIGIVRDLTRTRDSGVWSEVSEEEDWEERRRRKRRTRKRRRRRGKRWSMARSERAEEDPGEDYYFSKSKAVVQRLWRGNASAGMLSPRLQKAMKDYLSANKHQVAYKGRRRSKQSGLEVLCELKRQARVSTLDGTEPPFAEMGWAKMVPPRPLEELHGSQFKTCAVVTSAGAILNSSLGREIDSHEAVLRFNAAPTEGYENDVGNKTTIRIINSQILARPKHHFNTNSLYKDVTLVAWDPAPYSVDLPRWYRSPDYDLFTPYIERRRLQPSQPFYILHPKFIWQLWDVIQGNTQESIQPNPPSSGFIGILLMMELCQEVHVYEYIPSLRQTDLCHYHERYYDAACTLGAYHPLLYEKMLVQRMNMASEQDLSRKGKVTLPGFSAIDCGP